MFDAIAAAEGTSFLCIPDMLKALPSEEGGERFLYLEASNEARDYQGEVVLAKALSDSADYYLRYGNLDLDHITQIGPKVGIPNYPLFEIGRPSRVEVNGSRTFVKAHVYQGDTPVAARANEFWDSLTKVRPPQQWFPSVGGSIQDKGSELDPKTRSRRTVIRQVRWTNIGLSKTPVNLHVPSVSTVPIGVLAKCWGPGGLDLAKALTAGSATDAAAATGGAALARQSLDRRVHSQTIAPDYFDFRDRMAAAIRRRSVQPSPDAMAAHAREHLGLGASKAADWTERFLADLENGRNRKRSA